MMDILVIDSDDTSDLLCEYLQNRGHRCTSINNGRDVLEALNKNQYDITLLEPDIPGFDGYDIINDLYKTRRINKQNIVILTASNSISEKEISKLKNRGIRFYFKKPLTADFLLNILNLNVKAEMHSSV